MAVPTGSASMSDIRSEWDRTGSISMSEMYRGGTYVKSKASDNTADNLAADVPTSGAISVDNFRGEAKGFRKTFTATATDQSASTIFGDDYDLDYPKEIVIDSGVELGATSTSEEALEVESGLAGGLTITNNGTLTGAGGAAGSDGGDAFEAAASCTFVNNGTVRAGGGGGGTGGTGGNGSVTSTTYYGASEYASASGCQGVGGGCCGVIQYYGWGKRCYCCSSSSTTYYGGSGGSGGVGAGYNQSAGTGSSGSGGGSNAGSGGSGGAGGTFGASGTAGSNGGNGNSTNGSSGGSAGAAGKYLRGSSFVTFTNNGTVQGGTA